MLQVVAGDNALANSKVVATIPQSSGYCYFHSFGMSQNYIIFPEMPAVMNPWKIMTAFLSRRSFSGCLEWRSDLKVNVPQRFERFFLNSFGFLM